MNMKMLYDWLSEIKTIERDSLVFIGVSDICSKGIELRVNFVDPQGKKYECIEVINVEEENDLFNRGLFISLNRIKLIMKSKCLFNKE